MSFWMNIIMGPFSFSNVYLNLSLCIYFTLFTLTPLAFKLYIWFPLLSLPFFKMCAWIGFRYILSVLPVPPITPDRPYLVLLQTPHHHHHGAVTVAETQVKGLFFPWHRFIIDFLREAAFPSVLGKPDDLKHGYKRNFVIPQKCNVTNKWDITIISSSPSNFPLFKSINGSQTSMRVLVSVLGFGNRLVRTKSLCLHLEFMLWWEKASSQPLEKENKSYANLYCLLLFLLFKNLMDSKTIPGKLVGVEVNLNVGHDHSYKRACKTDTLALRYDGRSASYW